MVILWLSILFISIITFEVPGLIRKKLWRELAAFSVLLVVGMIYSYGLVLNLPLPNPTKGIMAVFKPVGQFFEKLLS